MKFYLSSYKMGDKVREFQAMISGTNHKAAYIPNALDFATDLERRQKSEQGDRDELEELGLQIERIDLREYFGKSKELESKLAGFDILWVRGGNAFVLRQAMRLCGFDEIIKKMISVPNKVYGAYSAGACVLSPSLKGIDLMDDLTVRPYPEAPEILWEGLGIIDFSIVPHFRSDHNESELAGKAAAYFAKNKIPFKTIRDGEVIIFEVL